MLFRRRSAIPKPARAALARVLAAPTFELIPLSRAIDLARLLPAGATVSVTASPSRGIEATVGLAESLAEHGFRAVPHLAARMIRDGAHLAELTARLNAAGVDRAFVVAGDTKEPGAFLDGLSLLRALADLGRPIREIGIPGYPQGHPFIPDPVLLENLHAKAVFASWITTQLCFDPAAIRTWIAGRRTEGLGLPILIGVPGVAEPHRLLAITARLGVADTQRFLTKNSRFVARLLRSGGFYRPDGLLESLAPLIADPAQGINGLHVYTFNAVEASERWRRRFVANLAAPKAI